MSKGGVGLFNDKSTCSGFGFSIPALILVALVTNGCAAHRMPTIAHVHVGHALTGWYDTPRKEGFFVVAEEKAHEAFRAAERATSEGATIDRIKADISAVLSATDPEGESIDPESRYGVKKALNEAINHITFAAESQDASENVRASADAFADNGSAVIDRCDLITILGNDIKVTDSQEEAELLAGEIRGLMRANIYGEDLDRDGVVGSDRSEYGLEQLREELSAIVKREDPPYETVDTWYLFNLIKLPSGEWMFRKWFDGGGGGYR